MSNKTPAIIVSIIMVVLVSGVVGYAVIKTKPKPVAYAPIPVPVASTGALTQDGTSPSLGVSSQSSGMGLQSNLGGSASGTSGGSGSNSSSTAIPGPETFTEFDKYKDGETAMFMDIVKGTGTEVAAGTKVAVTYTGWLTNGKQIDASPVGEDGKTQSFTLTVGEHKVILGWEQALVGMKVGGKRRLIIPPKVGYGEQGQDPIPPNAVLVFDVVLLAAL